MLAAIVATASALCAEAFPLGLRIGEWSPDVRYGGLTFTAETPGSSVTLQKFGSPPDLTLECSSDGVTWVPYQVGSPVPLTLRGDRVCFRAGAGGNRAIYDGSSDYHAFSVTGRVSSAGNVNSLLSADYGGVTSMVGRGYCFKYLFRGCAGLVSAPDVPATILDTYCYDHMFSGCTDLVTAPSILPADTLKVGCYQSMFYDCPALEHAPELPATNLAAYCYVSMFGGCGSLTTLPRLPAREMKQNCYQAMFSGCAAEVPAVMDAEVLAPFCFASMYSGSGLTEAPALPFMTLEQQCYSGMFSGCLSLETSPVLPATVLANACYRDMFRGCSSLKTITLGYTGAFNVDYAFQSWVYEVPSSGTFRYADGRTDFSTGTSAIPEGWTVEPYVP